MLQAVEADIPPDPLDVRIFRAAAIMPHPHCAADLGEQLLAAGRRGAGGTSHVGYPTCARSRGASHHSGRLAGALRNRVPEHAARSVDAGRLLDIPVYDHLVLGAERYLSFAEAGLL